MATFDWSPGICARICNSRQRDGKGEGARRRVAAISRSASPLWLTICIARPRFSPRLPSSRTGSNSRGPAGRPISDFLAPSWRIRKSMFGRQVVHSRFEGAIPFPRSSSLIFESTSLADSMVFKRRRLKLRFGYVSVSFIDV